MALLDFLHRVAAHQSLTAWEAEKAMEAILTGAASTPQIAAFLTALRMKGETPDEIFGFAKVMRAHSVRVDGGEPRELLDTCGTGGDGAGTFNISTAAALVVAGAGVRVAKHGNRSISSQCGSADILEELGVNVALGPEQMGASIREAGIGFLFAPALHPAMKHAQPARLELKMRTAFNLLGPLTNPARAAHQLAGAPTLQAAELMAMAMARLGTEHGFVVHGSDGLDEVTTTGPTHIWEIRDGMAAPLTLTPEDFDVPRADGRELRGGGRRENAAIVRAVLGGENGPRRDIVLVNAALALVAAGRAATPRDGVGLAAKSIDSGSAADALDRLGRFSRGEHYAAGLNAQ